MINSTTPQNVDDAVLQFCREISASTTPVFLDLTPADGCKLSDCFNNVKRYCNANGGALQHGWIIWYSKGFFIEAEFHGVWRSETDDLFDITPKIDGEQRILFLPDPNLIWNKSIVPNRRKALQDNPVIRILIDQGHALDEIKSKYCDRNGRLRVPQHVMDAHQQETMAKMMTATQSGGTPQAQPRVSKNSKCPCGSGRKIKHCQTKGLCGSR